MTDFEQRSADTADALIAAAKSAGAEKADAVVFASENLSVAARGGALEHVERDESFDFGLRVFVSGANGYRLASVGASDGSPSVLAALAQRAVAMAREAPEDPYADLAAETMTAQHARDVAATLALVDDSPPPSAEKLLDDAMAMEAAAQAISGVTQVESAGVSWRSAWAHLATSTGFSAGYLSSYHARGVAAVAGSADDPDGMERDHAHGAARRVAALKSPEALGREAGERAARRRYPRKAKTGTFPVIFEQRVASSFTTALLNAVNGASVARGGSFLQGKMGRRILPENMSLIDDPLSVGGLGARPFDGEGLATRRKALIESGVLSDWLLDLAAAKQLGMASNGAASRGASGSPSPAASTAWLTAGDQTPQALMADINEGLFITAMMGGGVNPVSWDYSRGAAGFWIENGAIAYPVSELTVAGKFDEMILAIEAGDDLAMDRRIDAPTLRVDSMMVASNA